MNILGSFEVNIYGVGEQEKKRKKKNREKSKWAEVESRKKVEYLMCFHKYLHDGDIQSQRKAGIKKKEETWHEWGEKKGKKMWDSWKFLFFSCFMQTLLFI